MKLCKYIKTLDEFHNMKVSANVNDTQYIVYASDETATGTPEVMWKQIVFIKEPPTIWTHGQHYFAMDENVLSDIVEIDERIRVFEGEEPEPEPDTPDSGEITFTLHQNKYGIEKTYTAYAGMTWEEFTSSDEYDHTSPEGIELALFWNLGSAFILYDESSVAQEFDTVIRNGYVYTYTGN